MLQFEPTKHGTGVVILGDYGDLKSLHETLWKLMPESTMISMRERNRLLTFISYEVRHATQKDRICEKRYYDGDNEVLYLGCQIDWICLLFSISCLRYNAGYTSLDRRDLANLMLLEHWTEKAMELYDSQGAAILKSFINARIDISNDLVYHAYQSVWFEFISAKPGKQRFRKIPDLIWKYTCSWAPEYKLIKEHFDKLTVDKKTTVCDYEATFSEIEIVW